MTRLRRRESKLGFLSLLVVCGCLGCAGGLPPTQFTNPDFDFAFVETVAVLPLENLSSDRQAGVRATRLLITELSTLR